MKSNKYKIRNEIFNSDIEASRGEKLRWYGTEKNVVEFS